MRIYCCECKEDVEARLVTGKVIYEHRPDLYKLPFWQCPTCLNFVGCHHKTNNPTTPLGCIPTKEIKELRKQIHSIIDPMYKFGNVSRKEIYIHLNNILGWEYHTAKIRTVEEAHNILEILKSLDNKTRTKRNVHT